MIHIALLGGNGPGGAAEGRIPKLFLKKKGFGRASRERPCLSAFWAKTKARRAVFSSDLTSVSKNKHRLLVFMDLREISQSRYLTPPPCWRDLHHDIQRTWSTIARLQHD